MQSSHYEDSLKRQELRSNGLFNRTPNVHTSEQRAPGATSSTSRAAHRGWARSRRCARGDSHQAPARSGKSCRGSVATTQAEPCLCCTLGHVLLHRVWPQLQQSLPCCCSWSMEAPAMAGGRRSSSSSTGTAGPAPSPCAGAVEAQDEAPPFTVCCWTWVVLGSSRCCGRGTPRL